ncbi:biopolymer transporter ExbD [Bacteroidales bacterium OttesenSCG-928-I14]|nr:biopolymer transporter ExbD [Bacteroidales bacterium OttesenSCG-928-I14]
MSRFRKTERREVPVLNTAALPDLIFTILFFFMIVTSMRPVPVLTSFELPQASELQKLKEKNQVVYVMIGVEQIQVDSLILGMDEMSVYLEEVIQKQPVNEQDKMVAVLKVDKNTSMGVVNEVKQKLREANILTLHYSLEKTKNKDI